MNVHGVCVQVVSSAIVDKYIGESARLIREMFAFARDHEPCIIFMDEIDAIGQSIGFCCGRYSQRVIVLEMVLVENDYVRDGIDTMG